MAVNSRVTINKDKCKGCLICISACVRGSLVVDSCLNKRGTHPVKHKEDMPCSGCAMCAIVCPDGAIRVYHIKDQHIHP